MHTFKTEKEKEKERERIKNSPYKGYLYKQWIYGDTIAEMLRKATDIANNYKKVVDRLAIVNSEGKVCIFTRINQRRIDNSVIRGKWH